jgi:hypothetical protein
MILVDSTVVTIIARYVGLLYDLLYSAVAQTCSTELSYNPGVVQQIATCVGTFDKLNDLQCDFCHQTQATTDFLKKKISFSKTQVA